MHPESIKWKNIIVSGIINGIIISLLVILLTHFVLLPFLEEKETELHSHASLSIVPPGWPFLTESNEEYVWIWASNDGNKRLHNVVFYAVFPSNCIIYNKSINPYRKPLQKEPSSVRITKCEDNLPEIVIKWDFLERKINEQEGCIKYEFGVAWSGEEEVIEPIIVALSCDEGTIPVEISIFPSFHNSLSQTNSLGIIYILESI